MNIAMITGGETGEREVSIQSAHHIQQQINFAETTLFTYPDEWDSFVLRNNEFDLVIPVIHGAGGEDGVLQEKLQKLTIPYIFSKPISHKECFNKKTAKQHLEGTNIRYPKTHTAQDISHNKDILYPVIAKPHSGGSSIGIYLINNQSEFFDLDLGDDYIFEEFIVGREFTIGVIDYNNELTPLPVMEAKKTSQVFDFEQKYSEQSADIEIFPEDLDASLDKELKNIALFVHNHFNLSHISRTDVMVNERGEIYFIEVNTIPGMTEKSWIPKMLNKARVNFSELLQAWVENAL